MPRSDCLHHAILVAIGQWAVIAPAGTVISVLIATPGCDIDVYSPGGQNPAETYGVMRAAVVCRTDSALS